MLNVGFRNVIETRHVNAKRSVMKYGKKADIRKDFVSGAHEGQNRQALAQIRACKIIGKLQFSPFIITYEQVI